MVQESANAAFRPFSKPKSARIARIPRKKQKSREDSSQSSACLLEKLEETIARRPAINALRRDAR